jgi:excisionase family DNA binding protein
MSTSLLTKDETAEVLRLTPRQVGKLARRGDLPSVNLPGNEVRFDPDDIRQWVESRKRPAAEGGRQ